MITISGSTGASLIIPAAWNSGTYTWRIRHETSCDQSDWIFNSFIVNQIYTASANSIAGGIEPYNANLNWTGNALGNKYIIQISTNGGTTYGSDISVVGSNYAYNSLTQGSYSYRVKADTICNDGWHTSSPFSVTAACSNAAIPTSLVSPTGSICTFSTWNFSWSGTS